MDKGQGNISGYTVEQEQDFYDKAALALKEKIKITENVTLLKKIYAAGLYRTEVFDRYIDLAFGNNNDAESMIEILNICRTSKEKRKNLKSRIRISMNPINGESTG